MKIEHIKDPAFEILVTGYVNARMELTHQFAKCTAGSDKEKSTIRQLEIVDSILWHATRLRPTVVGDVPDVNFKP
jgi:hypothetical protein